MAFSVCIVVVVVVVAGIFGTFSKESLLPHPGISEPEEMDFPPYSFFLLPFFKHLNHWIELSNFAFQFGRWKKNWKFYFSFIIIIAFILSKWEKIKQAMNEWENLKWSKLKSIDDGQLSVYRWTCKMWYGDVHGKNILQLNEQLFFSFPIWILFKAKRLD